MRKILSFLMLFCVYTGIAWAQTQITDVAQLSNNKVYTIVPKDITRGAIYATSTSNYLDACGGTRNEAANPLIAIDASSSDQHFAFYTYEGNTYLFSIGANKYVSDVEGNLFPLVEKPGKAVTIENSDTEGYFIVKVKGTDNINVSTGHGAGCVGNYNTTDDGNRLLITEIADIPADALAKITEDFNKQVELVYVYKTGETELARETIVATKGDAYPQPSAIFGVTFNLPEGNVPNDIVEGAEVSISCDINLPFQVSTLTDDEFGANMKWYYLTMRSKDVTYDSSTGMALAQNVDEKTAYNLFAFIGNPFDGFSIYNYAAGPDKVFWRANADDGGRVFFTNKEETDGNTWMLSQNGTSGYVFRLNGYSTGYMNDHQPQIAIWNSSWGATDGGSTFTFEYVENPVLPEIYNITYEYVYGDDVKSTQTYRIEEGSEYPVCGYFAPYGVTVGAKPEGTVSANGTYQIALNVTTELPFKAATDVANIDTWYYAQMHANQSVTAYLQDTNEGTNIEWKDKTVDVTEIDSHLWGYVGDVWTGIKMVNKATGRAIVSTSGPAVLGDASNATAFIPTLSNGSISNWFCLKYPASNYLNASGEQVNSYNSADNGSSFYLTEYKETEVSVSETTNYATLYLGQPTYIPEGVEVYGVTATTNGYATLTAINGILPANTGAILKNAGTYTFKTAGAKGSAEGNLLHGSVTNTYVEGDAYVLANGTNGVALYKAALNKNAEGAEGTTHFLNNANKAYLPAPTASATNVLRFSFGEETAIENVEMNDLNSNAPIYDLSGRRVMNTLKGGIYIQNGKKFIVK